MTATKEGLVSVVLVNFRGTDDTLEAIARLDEIDWPRDRLEIVVVDNASGDDSLKRITASAPHVVLVESKENLGFSGGCNLGVRFSSGEIIAFLNNDAKPDAGWIRAAMQSFEQPEIGAVASKVLDWEGQLVDFIDAGLTWFGMGYKAFTGEPVPKNTLATPRDVLFGTGSAMFVRRSVFEQLHGFDERYFMFFEDVDLGWRLNLLGWRFFYNPESIAYHKHHASMAGLGEYKETYLLERNALYTLYKNADPAVLEEALPATLALSIRRAVARGGLDSTILDIRRGDNDAELELSLPKQSVAAMFAIDQFVENLPSLSRSREKIQSTRVVSDSALWKLFGLTDAPALDIPYYVDGYEKLTDAFDVVEPPVQQKVLIITGDPIGERMAGPAIRAWNMALALARISEVTLVSLSGVTIAGPGFRVVHVEAGDDREFAPLEGWADVIIFQGHAMDVFQALASTKKIVVADIYDPMHLEQLEQGRKLPIAEWTDSVAEAAETLNRQLLRADFMLCASERQRMFYLGQLSALGRINPANYVEDPDLGHLLAVVPFGLTSEPPRHVKDVLKGVRDGIGTGDKVLIWSGGLYNWFDPLTLVRAVSALAIRRPEVRLFFQGVKHPHPGVPEMEIVATTRELARSLGTLDKSVFINDSWVDFRERGSYLIEADAGVSTHLAHVETTFSFRTRILDYLWAELPIVVTEGDFFADLVRGERLGIVVPPEDPAALEVALERVLFDDEFVAEAQANIARVRESFYWERVLTPLVRFISDPHPAADRAGRRGQARARPRKQRRRPVRVVRDAGRMFFYLRNGGIFVVIRKIRRRLRL